MFFISATALSSPPACRLVSYCCLARPTTALLCYALASKLLADIVHARQVEGSVWSLEKLKQHIGHEAYAELWRDIEDSVAFTFCRAISHWKAAKTVRANPFEVMHWKKNKNMRTIWKWCT